MDTARKVSHVCKNNAQGSRIRGRPKNRWWNCELTDINRGKIKNWKGRLKNRADWAKSVKGAKLRIGLWCLLGRRRRRRRRRRRMRRMRRRRKEEEKKEGGGGGEGEE
jgi:hypothetical protein